jgi:hypothetical protein
MEMEIARDRDGSLTTRVLGTFKSGRAGWCIGAATMLLIALVGLCGTAVAAEAPGWSLSAAAYPTGAVDGVDASYQVTAEEPTFTLFYSEEGTAAISETASASTVQADLEALPNVGSGNVQVTSSTPGTYQVTFVNALGDMKGEEFEGSGAAVSLTTEGSASGTFKINVFNVGAGASGGTVTLTDVLPEGVKAKEAGELRSLGEALGSGNRWGIDPVLTQRLWDCTGNGTGTTSVAGATVVTCTNDPTRLATIQGGGGVPDVGGNVPQPPIGLTYEASATTPRTTNRVSISGGGALNPASTQNTVVGKSNLTAKEVTGLTATDTWFSNADGTIDSQAGTHPYEMTTVLDFATALNGALEGVLPDGEVRNLEVQVPAGLVGNLKNVPQCTRAQLSEEENGRCPQSSEIGTLEAATFSFPIIHGVYNMAPPPGTPAELAFKFGGVPVYLDFGVRSGGDYGIDAKIENIPQRLVVESILTLWGVPGEHSHDRWRGPAGGCTQLELEHSPVSGEETYCTAPQIPVKTPILTLPTQCASAQSFVAKELSGWQYPSAQSEVSSLTHDANQQPIGFTGCENLVFGPSLTVVPETSRTDSPTGLLVNVNESLGGLEVPTASSSSAIKDVSVTLPAGMAVNPGQAAGLQACTPSQAALERLSGGAENNNAPSCPAASKIGTATAKSPLIEGAEEKELTGSVYVLESNPPHLKLLAALAADGVNVKLELNAELNEATGQITTTVLNAPQDPVSNFKLTFNGGSKATLTTPTTCGSYTSSSNFTPWSSPYVADVSSDPAFSVTEGAGGGACPSGALPFAPTFAAGSTNTEAGAFTSFSTVLQRGDGQQRVETLQFKSPAGLAAMVSSVPLCAESEANAGTCPGASQIGHAVVAAGPGNNPLTLPQPGAPELPIYLTGPYKGAPFGLSIVTPVIAGPFNLGTIVTRARIEIDPTTAQVTVMTDPLPQIVKGVPTDLRSIQAVIDRPNFFFNPTNCNSQQFEGTATSAGDGATAKLSSQFTVGACQALKFTPKLTASTSAKTSKANGASFNVKITYPAGAQAHIGKVALTIPAILPTRLTTIQKACTEAQFNANPAGCPAGSVIATATVHTPVLKSPLTGPVYFVSHGNAAFPDVEMVLQGEHVTLVVDGKTQIKKGVTYSRFEAVPDEPFSSFEFTAPEGPHSILTANGNLCGTEVMMPTTLTGQNGATLTQTTHVEVVGCPSGVKVLSHSVKSRKVTVKVEVPSAGKLTATGRGLKKASKTTKGRSTVSLILGAKQAHGRLKTKVKLTFVPSKGRRSATSVAATIKH